MSHAWTHSWCKSPSRDEAVRAAEDGRSGPLPTLEEAIAMMAKTGSASSGTEHENNGDGMTKSDRQAADYRAEASERITQALTADRFAAAVAEADRLRARVAELESCDWVPKAAPAASDAAGTAAMGELRDAAVCLPHCGGERLQRAIAAVERLLTHVPASGAAERMADTVQRLAAMSEDPGRTVVWEEFDGAAEPVAWLCEWADHTALYDSLSIAEAAADGDIVPQPLYRSRPAAVSGWLMPEEREAVTLAAQQAPENDFVTTVEGKWINKTLTDLLARSPPEVVLPLYCGMPDHAPITQGVWDDCIRRVCAALAAAGVTVKEVGK